MRFILISPFFFFQFFKHVLVVKNIKFIGQYICMKCTKVKKEKMLCAG